MARIITAFPPEVKKMGAKHIVSTRGVISEQLQANAFAERSNIPAEATRRREPFDPDRAVYFWTWYEVTV